MAFRPISTTTIDIKKHLDKPFEGTLVRHEEKDGQYGKSLIWHFVDDNDTPFSIFGFTMLNSSMLMIKPGTLCRVTYKGTEKVKTKRFGIKDVHQVFVEIDSDDEKDSKVFADGAPIPEDAPF